MPTAQDYNNIIYTTAVNQGYPDTLANILVAQAQYETGGYKNNAFLKGLNAFGYKYVKGAKYQLADAGNTSTEGNAYAKYPSLENSTLEVLAWLERRAKEGYFTIDSLTTPEAYAAALKSADYYGQSSAEYATGLSYYTKLFQGTIINLAKNNPIGLIAGVVLILGASYIAYKKIKK